MARFQDVVVGQPPFLRQGSISAHGSKHNGVYQKLKEQPALKILKYTIKATVIVI